MASYDIGSSKAPYVGFSNGSYGIGVGEGTGANRIHDFFKKIMPGIANSGNQIPTTVSSQLGMTGRWKGDWTLSDMLANVSQTIMEAVETITYIADQWYFEICPLKSVPSLKVTWSRTEFRPRIPTVTPPRSRVRLLDVKRSEGATSLTRLGIGMEADDETLDGSVPKGIEWYMKGLDTITQSVIEGDALTIICGIMTAHRNQPVYFSNEQYMRKRQLANIYAEAAEFFGSAWKEKTPFEHWDNIMELDMRAANVPQDNIVWILHEHTLMLISETKADYNRFYLAGPEGPTVLTDGRKAFVTVRGKRVYGARTWISDKGSVEVMLTENTVSLMNRAIEQHRNAPHTPYKTASRTIRITDVTNQGMATLKIEDLDRASGRWDIDGTGELNTFDPADPAGPHKWANMPAEHMRNVPDTGDMLHEPGTNKRYKYWGSVPESTVPSQWFVDAMTTFMANLGDEKQQRYERAIDALYNAVRVIEAQDPTTAEALALWTAVAALGKGTRPANAKGLPPVVKLQEILRDSRTDSLRDPLVARINLSAWPLPPGFGTYGGLQFLATNAAQFTQLDQTLLKSIVDALPVIKELVSDIRHPFAHSVALDVNYASSQTWYPSVESMFVDHLLLPRRLPIWVSGSAAAVIADTSAQLQQLRDTYLANLQAKYANIATTKAAEQEDIDAAVAAGRTPPRLGATINTGKVMPFVIDGTANELTVSAFLVLTLTYAKTDQAAERLFDLLAAANPQTKTPAEVYELITSTVKSNRSLFDRNANAVAEALETLLRAASQVQDNVGVRSAPELKSFVRTPLVASPEQITKLGAYMQTAGAGTRFPTVSRDGAHEYAASVPEVISYAENVSALVAGQALDHLAPIEDARQIAAVHNVASIRAEMAQRGIAVPSGISAAAASALARGGAVDGSATPQMIQLLGGGGGSVPRPAAVRTPATGIGSFLANVDDDVAAMVNDNFKNLWLVAGSTGSLLHMALIRVYACLPTNYRKSIAKLRMANVRTPTDYAVLRTLHEDTYPVIRLVPGEQTMFLGRAHSHMHWGTDQRTGIFGVYYTYYSGFVPLRPEWINKRTGVDTFRYKHGMGGSFRNVALHAKNPSADQGDGRDLLVVMLPCGKENMPPVFNPGGSLEVINDAVRGIVAPITFDDFPISRFENYRVRWMHHRTMRRADDGRSIQGLIVEPDNVTPGYYEDTTFYPTPDGEFTRYLPSRSPFPTQYATLDLRKYLDGKAATPDVLSMKSLSQL